MKSGEVSLEDKWAIKTWSWVTICHLGTALHATVIQTLHKSLLLWVLFGQNCHNCREWQKKLLSMLSNSSSCYLISCRHLYSFSPPPTLLGWTSIIDLMDFTFLCEQQLSLQACWLTWLTFPKLPFPMARKIWKWSKLTEQKEEKNGREQKNNIFTIFSLWRYKNKYIYRI